MPPRIPLYQWVKPDVYPLIACVGVGTAFFAYKGWEKLYCPDVQFSPERRHQGATEKFSVAEGDAWKTHTMRFYRHKDDSIGNLSMFAAFTPQYWERRAEVSRDPHTFTAEGASKLR